MIKRIALAAIVALSSLSVWAGLPSSSLRDINGRTVDTATISNDGKPVIITFFATWCKPCMRELKAINELYADWQDETGVKVIAVSIDEAQTSGKVKPLADSEGWNFDVLLDPNSDFARQLGVQSVPHLIIIDGSGNIVESHPGYTDGSEEHVYDVILGL